MNYKGRRQEYEESTKNKKLEEEKKINGRRIETKGIRSARLAKLAVRERRKIESNNKREEELLQKQQEEKDNTRQRQKDKEKN